MNGNRPPEKESTSPLKNDLFGPARASMRARLGEFVDIYMDAKIKVTQKLFDEIAGAKDVDSMMALRAKLNDVILTEDDIKQFDAKIGAFVTVLQRHATAFIKLQQEVKDAAKGYDPHH
ncbi:MAG: hypothetical protein WC444_00125 [Candidatus Paceibacterota bacterium]